MAVKGKDLQKLGWPPGSYYKTALAAAGLAHKRGDSKSAVIEILRLVFDHPESFREDPLYSALAGELLAERARQRQREIARRHHEGGGTPISAGLNPVPVPYSIWGPEGLDGPTLTQMETACRLPVAVRGAQMPDGHVGYGLPIGGVLATDNSVIPYGVGVDIACRMKLSIVAESSERIPGWRDMLKKTLTAETRFGVGAAFHRGARRQHDVMDDPAWDDLPPMLLPLKDKAWEQLGTSGSGNHFVEWGELILDSAAPELGLAPGRYLALLSHSGSRGFGAEIARHYTQLATKLTRLPPEAKNLAWLDLATEAGLGYWNAMNLAGRYASANHYLIHKHILAAAGLEPAAQVENHHNFAWIERHHGRELVVHRKGATPAAKGELGIIPGSMGDPGFLVRGKGNADSLNSAAHGAGRRMSRASAKKSLTRHDQITYLKDRGIELIAGGLDEAPQAYKNIREVMAAQSALVEPIAEFHPKIVLMAPSGPAED